MSAFKFERSVHQPLVLPDDRYSMVTSDNVCYGVELAAIAGANKLDEVVESYILDLIATWSHAVAGRPKILDLGGASGHRAEQLAALGCDVHIIDLCDRNDEVMERNRNLGRETISFQLGDLRQFDASWLPPNWDSVQAVIMTHVAHWMPLESVFDLVCERLPGIPGRNTHFALSFDGRFIPAEIMGYHLHNPDLVRGAMEARDYEIVYSDIEIQRDLDKPNIASCKLFAKLPQPQPSL